MKTSPLMSSKRVYLLSLGTVLLLSVYPLYMGAVMLRAYIQNGGIDVADYPSYIIPYTPICIAVIISLSLLPLVLKRCKRIALPTLSVLGATLFLIAETGFEQIAVFAHSSKVQVETWQMLSCIATPLVRASVWDSLNIRYNPTFKIHFYAIALLIVLAVIGIVHGFCQMVRTQNFTRKKPLAAQLICVTIFIGLCILACFTAFFRTGDINLSPLSAALMTIFFLIFGITSGVYTGTWLYEKRKLFSAMIPSVTAAAVTFVMYIGEMVMMNWALFRRGSGTLFDSIGGIPFSAVDFVVIAMAGVITYWILRIISTAQASSPS